MLILSFIYKSSENYLCIFLVLKWNSCLSCILLNLLFLYCSCLRDTYTRCQINTRYFNNCLK